MYCAQFHMKIDLQTPYIYIYLSILSDQIRENKWIYLEANHLSVFLVISYFFFNLRHF